MAYQLSMHQERFKEVAAKIKKEADGKRLKAELWLTIRTILEPSVAEVRSGILEMRSAGLAHAGAGLRQAVARSVKVGINTTGRKTGARVYATKRGMPRNFANAPRDLNKPQWTHPDRAGRDVVQVGQPGYFDKPLKGKARLYRRAIVRAVDDMAKRVAER